MTEMTCRETIEFLMAYLDGEIEPRARAEFDRHLAACPACVNYLRSYQGAIRAAKAALCDESGGGAAEAPPPPAALVKAVMDAVKRGRAG